MLNIIYILITEYLPYKIIMQENNLISNELDINNSSVNSQKKEKQLKLQPIKIKAFLNTNIMDDETKILLETKKQNLEIQLERINNQLKTINNIYEVEKFKKNDNDLSRKSINKENKSCCGSYSSYLFFNFNIIGPLFVIVNLIGVFQLIITLKATGKELLFGIKSFLFDKEREEENYNNIQENFETICLRNIPDFNLIFITSIIGNIFLKWLGFRIASSIYLLINSTLIFVFSFFDFPEKTYNFYQLLLCMIYYVSLLISVGSIVLFSHQIYFDGLLKYYKFIKKEEENNENIKKGKETFFSYLCFTVIPAYIINIIINYFLKDKNYFGYFSYISISLYVITTITSIIIYSIYSLAFVKEGKNILENELEINVSRICGYLIYSEKTIHEENKICCSGCRFGCRKGFHYLLESPLTCCIPCLTCICCKCVEICGCCPCLQCCECCKPVDLIESKQRKEFFCYCYKVQRKCSWFCDILFKKNTIVFIVFDITLELLNIGFVKIVNEKSIKYNDKDSIICLSIYIGSFLLLSLINRYICNCKCGDPIFSETFSIILIAFFSTFLSILFSGLSSFGNKNISDFTNDYLILISLASLRYFYFIIMNSLVNMLDENNIDILSNSTIISIFFSIYKMISSTFTDVLDLDEKNLIIFQFIFGIICEFPIVCSACCLLGNTVKSKAKDIYENNNENGEELDNVIYLNSQ